ncbi:hypothetical protein Tco_0338166, partial [Tanacetum coccineum]
ETRDDTTERGRLTGCGASGAAEDGPPTSKSGNIKGSIGKGAGIDDGNDGVSGLVCEAALGGLTRAINQSSSSSHSPSSKSIS